MNKISITGLIILGTITLVLLFSSTALYIMKENEAQKNISLEETLKGLTQNLEEVTAEKDRIAAELEEVKNSKSELELQVVVKDKEIQGYREKFDLVKEERGLLEQEKSAIIKKLTDIQNNYAVLKKDFEQLQQAKEAIEAKLKNIIASSIKLNTIIVEPEPEERGFGTGSTEEEAATSAKENIEGEVLAVNKEYEFLVINIGLGSGLKENAEVSVYRGAELIAVGKAEKLYENISAVIVEDKEKLSKVKVGDTAVVSVEAPGR